jgi:hypothetical protein
MAEVTGFALVANQDGRLELAATAAGPGASAPSGGVWYAHQTAPNGDWTGWKSLGVPVAGEVSAPAVAHGANWRLDVVVSGLDGKVWVRAQTDPSGSEWSDWRPLGQPGGQTVIAIGPPVLARNEDGRLEAFVVREDNRDGSATIWHAWQEPDGDWSQWISFDQPGSGASSDIAVAPNAARRLELFVTETNQHAIWHRWQDPTAPGGWSPWSSLGRLPGEVRPGTPVLARSSNNHVLLFTVGTNAVVWFRGKPPTPTSDWTPWVPLHSGLRFFEVGVGMDVGAEAAGRLLLVATSQENRLWHNQQQSASSLQFEGWASFGRSTYDNPGLLRMPTLAANADGRLELFLLSGHGKVYQYTQTGSSEHEPRLPVWSEGRVWGRLQVRRQRLLRRRRHRR